MPFTLSAVHDDERLTVTSARETIRRAGATHGYGLRPRQVELVKQNPPQTSGRLVCVGVGMTLGSHLTPLSRSHIEQADVVFTALADGVTELWLANMHTDVRSLQPLYREGQSRATTYRQMVD